MPTLAAAVMTEPHSTWQWIVAVFNIVWIDIVLAGDNAVVIALAVRSLPPRQRKIGIFLGAGAAVVLRGVLTVVTTHLLTVPYLKLVGGVLILWIAFKLLRHGDDHENATQGTAHGVWEAVWMIIVADITMSLDNVLAVGGAARGHNALIIFGLALSIPLVVFGSNLIAGLMTRYQIIVFIGAAILGKVAGEMILTDTFVASRLQPWWAGITGASNPANAYLYLQHGVEIVLVVAIFLYGWLNRRPPPAAPKNGP